VDIDEQVLEDLQVQIGVSSSESDSCLLQLVEVTGPERWERLDAGKKYFSLKFSIYSLSQSWKSLDAISVKSLT